MLRQGQRRLPLNGVCVMAAVVLLAAAQPSNACATSAAQPAATTAQTTPAERRVRVTGRVIASDGRRLTSGTVIMSPQDPSDAAARGAPIARLLPDGSFEFEDVPAGRYLIHARGETERKGPALFATFALSITTRDISGIVLTLRPGGTLEGRLELRSERGTRRPAGVLRVRAPLADGSALGDTLTGTVGPDGAFRLTGLMPGSHVLMIEGLTFPWRIASAQLQGRDVAETTFDLGRDQRIRDVHVMVTDSAGGVSGSVALPQGIDPGRAIVVAVPRDALRRRVPLRFVRTARPGADGAYRLLDLVPGEHLVAAVLDLEPADAFHASVLSRVAEVGTPVVVREAEMTTAVLEAVRLPGS